MSGAPTLFFSGESHIELIIFLGLFNLTWIELKKMYKKKFVIQMFDKWPKYRRLEG